MTEPAVDADRLEASETVTLTFENNASASALFGQYDQHVAVLERDLRLEASTRGNTVQLTGDPTDVAHASIVLNALYDRIEAGEAVEAGDMEGAIRQVGRDAAAPHLPPRDAEDIPAPAQDEVAAPAQPLSMASISTVRKTLHARTRTQDDYIRAMERSEMIFGTGPAGTGKTYLAVAHAAALLERGAVDRIILSRPAVEAGERLGFLPGDMKEKVDPYLRPLYDALYDMIPGDKVERAITSGVIEIAPLAFMRGRTLAHSAVILDEAQNTTTMQMKMFLTRLGEGSKMIITGDPSQIDLPRGQESGLVEALRLLKPVKGISMVAFTGDDVVRHKLVGRIVKAYDEEGRRLSQNRS
ncbi:PhoH family protein [Ahrensia sp. R2A130]|uniref:PhoH family protein n=1 Tax=Ahrensia sp. R2A130 TaxID=744979 RepID=UPI001FFE961E|nr:PhoH family protein [Ahrensia sp. R2A130]